MRKNKSGIESAGRRSWKKERRARKEGPVTEKIGNRKQERGKDRENDAGTQGGRESTEDNADDDD